MLIRVTYTAGGGEAPGARAFGTKTAAVTWILDVAEREQLREIMVDENWGPDCVAYKTDDVHRHLPFPECCVFHGSAHCDCGSGEDAGATSAARS
ncbi:MAG: hypothetical protein HY321_05605 [Armatimonadetes bacterium]|nr:hypothetical protein [Armatimonadota bacterium]